MLRDYVGLMIVLSALLGCVMAGKKGAQAVEDAESGFNGDAYYHGYYPYRIRLLKGKPSVLDDDWLLENYYEDEKAKKKKSGDSEVNTWNYLKPKEEGHLEEVHFDTDGDGTYETDQMLPVVDLEFRHRRNNSKITVSAYPMDTKYSETELKVLARNHVAGMSGTGELSIGISLGGGKAEIKKGKTFATRTLAERPLRLGGGQVDAYEITYELIEVEQLKVDPNAAWDRVNVVLARPGMKHRIKKATYPVVVLFRYVAAPDYFEEGLADFHDFIARTDFFFDAAKVKEAEQIANVECQVKLVQINLNAEGRVKDTMLEPLTQSTWATRSQRSCTESKLEEFQFTASGRQRLIWVEDKLQPAPPLPPTPEPEAEEPKSAAVAKDSSSTAVEETIDADKQKSPATNSLRSDAGAPVP